MTEEHAATAELLEDTRAELLEIVDSGRPMTPAGRDGGMVHEITFPHLVARRKMLRRLAEDGYPLAWTLARQVILDGYEERRLNTGERRRWFLRWWAGA